MTKSQIIKAQGEELSRMAGQCLQPEKKNMCQGEHTFGKPRCSFCGRTENDIDDIKLQVCRKRPQQRSIPLDWPNAMKWRDWAVEKFGGDVFWQSMYRIYMESNLGAIAFSKWVLVYARPEHYLKAAMLCAKEGGE